MRGIEWIYDLVRRRCQSSGNRIRRLDFRACLVCPICRCGFDLCRLFHGLSISGNSQRSTRPTALKNFSGLFQFARAWGSLASCFPSLTHLKLPVLRTERWLSWPCTRFCHRRNIRSGTPPGNRFESDNFRSLLDEIPHPLVKVNYDSGNSAALGYRPFDEFAAYGDRVGSFHIKDRLLGGGRSP